VDQAHAVEADRSLQRTQDAPHSLGTVEAMAGGMGVARVEADPDALVTFEQVEHVSEVAPVGAHLAAAPRGVLQQELHLRGSFV
jgi:hypothetical protein